MWWEDKKDIEGKDWGIQLTERIVYMYEILKQ